MCVKSGIFFLKPIFYSEIYLREENIGRLKHLLYTNNTNHSQSFSVTKKSCIKSDLESIEKKDLFKCFSINEFVSFLSFLPHLKVIDIHQCSYEQHYMELLYDNRIVKQLTHLEEIVTRLFNKQYFLVCYSYWKLYTNLKI
jgi:hypothetical protein